MPEILTNIDIRIIRMMADGLTHKEISTLLHYPEGTIETFRYRLFRKIKVKNAPHCIAWAFRNNVLQ